MKKLFIFDFDGTLFDSIDDVVNCLDKSLRHNNFPTLTGQDYKNCLGGNIDEIMSAVLGDNSNAENIEVMKKTYNQCYGRSKKENTKPFKGVSQVLEKLNGENVLLAINSNRSTRSIKFFTEKYFKDIDFVLIEGHNPDYPSKPHPYGVEKIIEKSGLSLQEAVYVGDSKTDIQTAKNAGIDCIIVKYGYGNENDWNDDYPIKTIDDISELINLKI